MAFWYFVALELEVNKLYYDVFVVYKNATIWV